MNLQYLNEFIDQIEYLCQTINPNDEITDRLGTHKVIHVLDSYIIACKELIEYGEYMIALENILDNLNEVSILLDSKIIDLARKAFGDQKTDYHEELLMMLSK